MYSFLKGEELRSFIAGLVESDGHIYSLEKDKRIRLWIATISPLETITVYHVFKTLGYNNINIFPLVTREYSKRPRLIISVDEHRVYEDFRQDMRYYYATNYPELFYAGFFYGDGYLKYRSRYTRKGLTLYLDRNYFEIGIKKNIIFLQCLATLSKKYPIHYTVNERGKGILEISVYGEPTLYNIVSPVSYTHLTLPTN